MNSQDKGKFSAALAALFSPPDESLAEFSRRVAPAKRFRSFTGVLSGSDFDRLLSKLKKEYDRLFADLRGERISLVESTYKAWTSDETCPLSIAGEKGLLMGDPALHILEIFRALGLAVPEEFRSTPDHLVLELEILSWLYRTGTESQARTFIQDHLDWIPDLKRRLDEADAHSFYRLAMEQLDLFLQEENEHWKDKEDGPQSVH